jgi:hypothetical protein
MKFKTTKKEVLNGYRYVISEGYCTLQHLLYYSNPIAYTSGVYGWNCDVYEIRSGVAISTGYRPFGNVKPDYKLAREYDNKALELINEYRNRDFDDLKKELDKLILEFVKKAIKEG